MTFLDFEINYAEFLSKDIIHILRYDYKLVDVYIYIQKRNSNFYIATSILYSDNFVLLCTPMHLH